MLLKLVSTVADGWSCSVIRRCRFTCILWAGQCMCFVGHVFPDIIRPMTVLCQRQLPSSVTWCLIISSTGPAVILQVKGHHYWSSNEFLRTFYGGTPFFARRPSWMTANHSRSITRPWTTFPPRPPPPMPPPSIPLPTLFRMAIVDLLLGWRLIQPTAYAMECTRRKSDLNYIILISFIPMLLCFDHRHIWTQSRHAGHTTNGNATRGHCVLMKGNATCLIHCGIAARNLNAVYVTWNW